MKSIAAALLALPAFPLIRVVLEPVSGIEEKNYLKVAQ